MFIQKIAFENVVCEMASFCLGFNVLNIDDMDKYQSTTKYYIIHKASRVHISWDVLHVSLNMLLNANLFACRFTGKDLYVSLTQPRKIYSRLIVQCGTRQARLRGLVRSYFSVRRILNSTGYCKLPG